MGAWLEKAAATLEKKHKGVYFEVESMTFSDYEARRERGEKADMYSFPLGWEYIEELQPIDMTMPEMRGNMADSCRYHGGVYGLPYAASGYVLAVNSRIITGKGLDMDMLCGMIRSGEAKASGDEIIACIYGARVSLGTRRTFLRRKAGQHLLTPEQPATWRGKYNPARDSRLKRFLARIIQILCSIWALAAAQRKKCVIIYWNSCSMFYLRINSKA